MSRKLPTTPRSKYNNHKVEYDGLVFASKKECKRYQELKLLEREGEIVGLETQVSYEIIPKCGKSRAAHYVADFQYVVPVSDCRQWHILNSGVFEGKLVVEDTKGVRTSVYKLKKKLMLWRHGIEIQEV